MEFRVRRARVEDLEALVPLFDAYRQFYEQHTDKSGAERFLRARLNREEAILFLAEGEQPLGFTLLYPSFSSVSLKPFFILNDLYVAPEARRSGVGEALLSAATEFARAAGAKGLCLETAKDNVYAQTLYEKCGWTKDEAFFRYNYRTDK